MGDIYKRTDEHLGTSDSMLIQMRRRLIRAAQALRDHGTVPPGVDNPDWYRIRPGSGTLAKGESWLEGFGDWLNARTNDVPETNLRYAER